MVSSVNLLLTQFCTQFVHVRAEFSTGEQRRTACGSSDGLRVPLTCSPSQWFHVFAERYSAAPPAGSNCTIIPTCQKSLASHTSGLDVSCNGPVGASGVCEEETEARKWLRDCMTGSQTAAVEVRYECLPGQWTGRIGKTGFKKFFFKKEGLSVGVTFSIV